MSLLRKCCCPQGDEYIPDPSRCQGLTITDKFHVFSHEAIIPSGYLLYDARCNGATTSNLNIHADSSLPLVCFKFTSMSQPAICGIYWNYWFDVPAFSFSFHPVTVFGESWRYCKLGDDFIVKRNYAMGLVRGIAPLYCGSHFASDPGWIAAAVSAAPSVGSCDDIAYPPAVVTQSNETGMVTISSAGFLARTLTEGFKYDDLDYLLYVMPYVYICHR